MTIQANQGFGVSVFGAVSGGGGTPGGLDTQVQFNSGGSFGASAAFTFVSPALTIGAQQSTQGKIVFANTAAGAFATTVQSSNSASAAWTLTLPATAGTANYALTTDGSGVSSWAQISLTAGVTGTLPLANGGTNANLTASNGGIVYSGASSFAVLSGTATAGQMLRSGASGAPSWSTATFPSTATSTGTLLRADGTNWTATTATFPTTTAAGTLLTSATANTVSASATPTLGVAGTTAGTLALSGLTSGTVTLQTAAAAGTGTIFQFPATNGASGTILTTTGSGVTAWSTATFPSTATSAGTILRADGTNWVATTAIYPTTTTAGTLLTSATANTVSASATPTLGIAGTTAGTLTLSGLTSGTVTLQTAAVAGTGTIFQFPSSNGASGTLLTTTGSGVTAWSTATFPSTATSAGTILRADGTNWVATTATYPTTTTANQLLYSSATNTVGGLTSANTSALVTNSSGVPSFTSGGTANRVLRTDGTTVSFAQVGLTTDVTGTLPVGNGGTGTSTTFTAGSVIFAGASGVYSQNNSNLFWDNANGRLGIGTASPSQLLQLKGSTASIWIEDTGVNRTIFSISASNDELRLQGTAFTSAVAYMTFFTNNAEKMRISTAGNFQATGGGLIMPAQAAPTSKGAAATLTGAELITGLLQYTGAADTITLPTGTNIEGALTWSANNVSLEWFVVNTGSGTCTIGANGNTTVGALTVAAGASGYFRIRRTAANTFTVYRLA